MSLEVLVNYLPALNMTLSGVGKYTYHITLNLFLKSKGKLNLSGLFLLKKRKFTNEDFKLNENKLNSLSTIKNFLMKNYKFMEIARFFRDKASIFVTADIYFEPNFVPLDVSAKRKICTVHDLSFFNPSFQPYYRVKYFSEGFIKKTLKADLIIVPSNFIKEEVVERFPWVEDRIKVIYHGIDHNIFNAKNEDFNKRRYILFVGNIEPRKNLITLLKAYSLLPDKYKKEFPLVIVSYSGWKNENVYRYIDEAKLYKYVKFKSNILKDSDLAQIYRESILFVFPSLYEGFGFPVIEAMACGCPVVASNRGSIPEICKDAAVYFNPYDPEELMERMKYLIDTPHKRKMMSDYGKTYSKKFSWEKAAEEYINTFLNLYGSSRMR